MRAAGLRVVQLWVPVTTQPDFAEQCQRQSELAARADRVVDTQRWLDAAFNELAGGDQARLASDYLFVIHCKTK